jgi:hypothetical protein
MVPNKELGYSPQKINKFPQLNEVEALNILVMTMLRILSTNSNDFVISHTLSISPKPRDCM